MPPADLVVTPSLLIVDDEKTQREGLRAALEDHYDVYLAEDARSAMEMLERDRFDVLLTDFRLPSEDGMKLIARAKSLSRPPVCILMTAYGSEDVAVEAMKKGADDYVSKGRLQIDELEMRIARALKQQGLEQENVSLRQQLNSRFGMEKLIGESPAMQEVLEQVQQVAGSAATVLLQGESGTGKEMVAKTIHQLSPRASQPLVTVHCAALAESLLDTFTVREKKGRVAGLNVTILGDIQRATSAAVMATEQGSKAVEAGVKKTAEAGQSIRTLTDSLAESAPGNRRSSWPGPCRGWWSGPQ